MSQYTKYPVVGGGGGGSGTVTSVGVTSAVPSILGVSGSPITTSGSIALTLVDQTGNTFLASPANGSLGAPTFRTLVAADLPLGTANTFAGFDNAGALGPIPGFTTLTASGGMSEDITVNPNNTVSFQDANYLRLRITPLQNSPDDAWNVQTNVVDLDYGSTGFDFGTNGQAVNLNNNTISHQGTGDVGNMTLTNNYLNIGNGTDPITIRGFQYSTGFGNINANVTISNSVQGYLFQPTVDAGATINGDFLAFADFSNIQTTSVGHTSFFANPQIADVATNHSVSGYTANPQLASLSGNAGYTGYSTFPNITAIGTSGNVQGYAAGGTLPVMTGGASYSGLSVSPTIGAIPDAGNFQGVSVNPTITLNNNVATGLSVNMNNVTNYAGAQASLVVQDITYTVNQAGTDGNNITVEYIDDVIAGSEFATLTVQAIAVHIQSGVSTATQVLAAINAVPAIISNASIVITGVASNAQITFAQTNLAGGINPGRKLAADLIGDVSIQGSLSFTGGLSIGALSSFASVDISGFPSGVNSIDTLITQPTVPASTTLATDLLAINTAMLLTIGDNSTLTSSFLGYTALGLPAVVSLGTGATIDRVTGATFAISLDASAAGGTIDEVDLCRAIGIPNGTTTVNNLYGYRMDMPFGDVGTNKWGVYITPTVDNYMAGSLVVGDVDQPTNTSVAVEIVSTTKAFLNARMTTAERNALTAVNGMQIYNTTTDKLQVYAAGSWVDLH